MKVRIHIGAHKTGTTHVQDSLDISRELLRSQRVVFVPRVEFRNQGFLTQLRSGQDNQFRAYIDSLRPKTSLSKPNEFVVLISEENILGSPATLLDGMYKSSISNIKFIQEIFKDDDIEIFISIRNYSTLLPSVYSESLVSGARLRPFPYYLKQWLEAQWGWGDLVDRVQRILPRARLVLWSFERYVKDPVIVLSRLSGTDIDRPSDARSSQRQRLSSTAIDRIQTCNRLLFGRLRTKALERIAAKSDGSLYDPVTSSEKFILSDVYAQHCDQIRRVGYETIFD